SLPLTYAPPAANKPLALSRRLVEMAPRRIADTMRFQLETSLPGGLRRFSRGFKSTLRTRLVHAQMRRVLRQSGRWNASAWGQPLNQADMAYVNVLFSAYPLGWLRRLGFYFTPEESDAVIQLWRYSGHLVGVAPALLCATEAEGKRLGALYEATQGPPDDDSRALTAALMQAIPRLMRPYTTAPEPVAGTWVALSRLLLGDAVLDGLGVPQSPYRHALPLLRLAVAQSEAIRRRSSRGTTLALQLGTEAERSIIEGYDRGDEAPAASAFGVLLGVAGRWVEQVL